MSSGMEKLQCEICAGQLVMSDDGPFAVYESCGMKYTKKAVQKMLIEFSGPVEVQGIATVDRMLNNAETHIKLGDYAKAHEIYKQVTEQYANDWRGWWGVAKTSKLDETAMVGTLITDDPKPNRWGGTSYITAYPLANSYTAVQMGYEPM